MAISETKLLSSCSSNTRVQLAGDPNFCGVNRYFQA